MIKQVLRFFLFICIFFLPASAKEPQRQVPAKQTEPTIRIPHVKKIRVLLEEHNGYKETKFLIKSPDGFVLESPIDSGTTALYQEKELRLLSKNKKLYFKCRDGNYRRIKQDNIEIGNASSKLVFNGTPYQGSLTIRVDDQDETVLVINKLPLEDYVYSVVRYESIPSWPSSMQKIQAIISRTYAVFLMQKARIKNPRYRFYDIKNTNHHQVYNGSHGVTHLRVAVNDTANLIVTHKGEIALTMFDICCGGSTPSLMRHRDVSKPYLCRKQRCMYCNSSPSFQWKADILAATFLAKLKENPNLRNKFKHFGKEIVEIRTHDTDKAGIVHRVKLYDHRGHIVTLAGSTIRRHFQPKVKSLNFSIKKVKDRILITGKGYGHQQGVCQWGAKEMVKRGRSIKGILNFYYPGTQLSRLL